jgi:hypothetical protein
MKSWDGQSNQAHRRSLLAGGRTVRKRGIDEYNY